MATNENAINLSSNVKVKMKKTKRWETPFVGYLFIAPWLIGFLALTLWPMIQSIYFSFTKYSLLFSGLIVVWSGSIFAMWISFGTHKVFKKIHGGLT